MLASFNQSHYRCRRVARGLPARCQRVAGASPVSVRAQMWYHLLIATTFAAIIDLLIAP
jgi:hypothetical protein